MYPTYRILSKINHNSIELEEEVIIRYTLDMDNRGFLPKLKSVEHMMNDILKSRSAKKVRKLWILRFVKRHTKLKIHFIRVYDSHKSSLRISQAYWSMVSIDIKNVSEISYTRSRFRQFRRNRLYNGNFKSYCGCY